METDGADTDGPPGLVQKVVCRTVISLRHGRFQACETIRQQGQPGAPFIRRSMQLADTVAQGGRYAFDLISYVGVKSYLHGRSLKDIERELIEQTPKLIIPRSSLWDQQQRFLFYLGHLHRKCAPLLREHLDGHRPVTWLLDGTLEPGTPVFLGIKNAADDIMLDGSKIPSENAEDIAFCLEQAAALYGFPDRILHDLSGPISKACDLALPTVPHDVCHYHFTSDIGKDLYDQPQAALCRRMRILQVQFQLKKQRRRQADSLRHQVDSSAQLMLRDLMEGKATGVEFNDMLGREVLLAFHFWILDYRSDGQHRGFPFDPYTLYLHRRLVRASRAVDDLLSRPAVARQARPVMFSFQQGLQRYRNDPEIVAIADSYERACAMFSRLRTALRMTPEHIQNLHRVHELPSGEQHAIKAALTTLRCQLREQAKEENDPDHSFAQIVLNHLEKYWPRLLPDQLPGQPQPWHRTTNALEKDWRSLKRPRRQAHGRSSLTLDFVSLPQEYLFVLNLQNPTYLQLLLGGSLETLPAKLAEASRETGPVYKWREVRDPQLLGRPPHSCLHDDRFIENLVAACETHCQHRDRAAA
jgi:hypothetical protein